MNQFAVITPVPEIIDAYVQNSILKKIIERKVIQLKIVNLRDLGGLNLDEIDPKVLYDNGLINSFLQPVKVLGDGELKKAIKVKATKFSQSAVLKIEKAGGAVEVE